jgi:hypothetical protein
MSHAAAHLIDGYMLMYRAGTVYIADKEALKGTLVNNLKPQNLRNITKCGVKYVKMCLEAKRFIDLRFELFGRVI